MTTDFTTQSRDPQPAFVDYEKVGPEIGTRFPDITLPDQTGRLFHLHADRETDRAIVVFHRSAGW